jgi:hypothetical protein
MDVILSESLSGHFGIAIVDLLIFSELDIPSLSKVESTKTPTTTTTGMSQRCFCLPSHIKLRVTSEN